MELINCIFKMYLLSVTIKISGLFKNLTFYFTGLQVKGTFLKCKKILPFATQSVRQLFCFNT